MSSDTSLTLNELQDIAEEKADHCFMIDRMTCLHSTLHAVQEAMSKVDDINYVHPMVIKCSNGILAGLWSSQGLCGIVLAGAMSLSLKYGTEDSRDTKTVFLTGLRSRDWYFWFKKKFGSCDCIDISEVEDWFNDESLAWYIEVKKDHCNSIMAKSVRKIVGLLTEEYSSV